MKIENLLLLAGAAFVGYKLINKKAPTSNPNINNAVIPATVVNTPAPVTNPIAGTEGFNDLFGAQIF